MGEPPSSGRVASGARLKASLRYRAVVMRPSLVLVVREPLSPPKVYAPRRADPAARTRHRGKITNLKSDKVLGLTFNRRSCSAMALVTSKVKKILLRKGSNAS